MTTFLQLHLLTSYPPACLNRDDLNRPKTAMLGGVPRLRVSSQSLKRAWRTSESFKEAVSGQTGIRSKEIARRIRDSLLSGVPLSTLVAPNAPKIEPDGKVSESNAISWALMIASEYVDKKTQGGKAESEEESPEETEEQADKKKVKGNAKNTKKESKNISKETLKSEQVVFYSKEEVTALDNLIKSLRENPKEPTKEQLKTIKVKDAGGATDLALFGRMLASSPDFNVEAACQVAHAVTVHRAAVEDDFFTAVDDLNTREEDAGSAHMGEQGFGAGLFYLYVCIDCDSLKANLGSDDKAGELAGKAIGALIDSAAKVAPTGKQNCFASRAYSFYGLLEKGSRQPRSLSLAFVKPVKASHEDGNGMLVDAINALETMRNNMDKVYHGKEETGEDGKKIRVPDFLPSRAFNAVTGEGSFAELLDWAVSEEP